MYSSFYKVILISLILANFVPNIFAINVVKISRRGPRINIRDNPPVSTKIKQVIVVKTVTVPYSEPTNSKIEESNSKSANTSVKAETIDTLPISPQAGGTWKQRSKNSNNENKEKSTTSSAQTQQTKTQEQSQQTQTQEKSQQQTQEQTQQTKTQEKSQQQTQEQTQQTQTQEQSQEQTSSAPDSAGNPVYQCQNEYRSASLQGHNDIRASQGKDALTWNDELAKFAAEYIASYNTCDLVHSGGKYGENLAMMGGTNLQTTPQLMKDLIKMWTDEGYNGNDEYNHYTQVVWRNTKQVGCAYKVCNGDTVYLACEYDPPGNGMGQFDQNI